MWGQSQVRVCGEMCWPAAMIKSCQSSWAKEFHHGAPSVVLPLWNWELSACDAQYGKANEMAGQPASCPEFFSHYAFRATGHWPIG